MAEPAKLVVFKNVFIQLYLPYSVRLMEQANIRYSIFNYYQAAIEVTFSFLCVASTILFLSYTVLSGERKNAPL